MFSVFECGFASLVNPIPTCSMDGGSLQKPDREGGRNIQLACYALTDVRAYAQSLRPPNTGRSASRQSLRLVCQAFRLFRSVSSGRKGK